MNKLLIALGMVAGVAALVGGGVLVRQQFNVGVSSGPLVNCEAIPNPVAHDAQFRFFLDLNGRHKDVGNFELDSVSVSDSGLALNSNVGHLKVNGPVPKKDPSVLSSIEVGKNTITIKPLTDDRDQIEQAVLLHVAVKLRDKKRNAMTITSAICQASIIHTSRKIVAPPVKPIPKPPILIKDKEGIWVEPPKAPATTPTKSPSFITKFQKYVTDNVTQMSVVVTPEDLAGQIVTGIEITLVGRGYTLPAVLRTSLNINDEGWNKNDWQCNVVGSAMRCSGATMLEKGKHTVVGLDFDAPIDTPPEFLNAKLLTSDGSVVVGIGIPFVP